MGKRTGPVKEDGGVQARRSSKTSRGDVTPNDRTPDDFTVDESGTELSGEKASSVEETSSEDPREIRENIEETRAEMGETLGALEEKLSPGHIKEQVKETVQEHISDAKSALRAATVGKVQHMIRDTGSTLSEARRTLWDTIRENPVPAALSAIGLTWLFLNRRGNGERQARDRFREGGFEADSFGRGSDAYGHGYGRTDEDRGVTSRAGEAVRQVEDKASGVAENAQRKVGELAESAKDTASRVADQAQVQARRVEQAFGRWMNESPVALGAVALAAGTAIGLALPRTEKEDQILGSARDKVVGKAEELASDAVETVRDRLSDVQEQPQTH